MELSAQVVPAVVILVANLLSGRHTSLRWETVTAVFGWAAAVSMVALLVVAFFASDSAITAYLLQVSAFCLLTALSRDYEKFLRPFFPWNR